MISWILAGFLMLQAAPADSGCVLRLAELHQLVEQQFPAADKIELQRRMTEINRLMAGSGRYPQLSASGMASYQSDVTEVTFTPPGADAPTFSRDHYRLSLELTQPIWSGGRTPAMESLEEASGERERATVRVELQQVKEHVNRVYFNALLLQKESESLALMLRELRSQLVAVRSRVEQGVLLASQQAVLEAEQIKVQQDSIRNSARQRGARRMLEVLTGASVDPATRLETPEGDPAGGGPGRELRPEFTLYDASEKVLDRRIQVAESQKKPQFSAFATTAYGRPGLDAFDDDLQAWYVVGVRLQWGLWDAVNAGRQQQVLRLRREEIRADQHSFERRLEAELVSLREEIRSLDEILQSDQRLIELSRQVAEEHSHQLKQGVITATEYLSALHRLNSARLNRQLHQVQRAGAVTDYNTKLGESIR